jgi:hypothetical protein
VAGRFDRRRDEQGGRINEHELEDAIRRQCLARGILRFHVRDARGMTRGFPDDVLIGARGLLWRELKSEYGMLTPDQRTVRNALRALGQDWALWRPADLQNGRIARELEEISL